MIAEAEMFDPRHYEAVRRPLLDAETMPVWCYTSEAFYRREVERIFRKVWNFIGAADRLRRPGDYFTLSFAGVPVIVLRDQEGELRAFANTCRHRGSALLEGEGNCRLIACPYHSWSYRLDGALAAAPEMDQTHGFDPAEHALVPIALASWGGFLFINFDPDPAPLADYLGDLPEKVAPYRLDRMACSRRKEYLIECNWKLFVENAKESYHIATVHRQTINRYASARSSGYWVEKANGQYCITFAKHENSMALLKGDSGFPPNESLAGRREAGGTTAPLIYPSTYLACTIDCAWYLELHPLGPSRTLLIHGALFPKDRLSRNDFEDVAQNYYKRWDITIEEDIVASERQQRGLDSPFARPGRFSHREPLVHEIDKWILERVLDA
ncbi:MAG TPA: aromatic ring-hydroxylating dioxygenase subunit alpha [Stellaceae bacterium]|nr:aromatic ring-hydroxylating dioxygenase subunit alpha [Stellaceae bacterium]